MKILTKEITKQLERNYGIQADLKPVVKLFVCVGGNATWLLTDIDQDGIAFGLCDLGVGFPELGYVDVNDLIKTLDWRLERDMHFTADKTLSEYATAARDKGLREPNQQDAAASGAGWSNHLASPRRSPQPHHHEI